MEKDKIIEEIEKLIAEPLKKFTQERFLNYNTCKKWNIETTSELCIQILCDFIKLSDGLETLKVNLKGIDKAAYFSNLYNSITNKIYHLVDLLSIIILTKYKSQYALVIDKENFNCLVEKVKKIILNNTDIYFLKLLNENKSTGNC